MWTSRQTADGAAACDRPGVRALATYLAVQQHLGCDGLDQRAVDGKDLLRAGHPKTRSTGPAGQTMLDPSPSRVLARP